MPTIFGVVGLMAGLLKGLDRKEQCNGAATAA
jgi:hypothetical protein